METTASPFSHLHQLVSKSWGGFWLIWEGKRHARLRLLAASLCVAASLSFSTIAQGGSARDYLNAPIDSWLTTYNAGYSVSVTPEDGADISSRTNSNVLAQSLVITRTMDYWGRTGGLSVVLPYAFADVNSNSFQARTNGVSDIAFLWQRVTLKPASEPDAQTIRFTIRQLW